MIRDDTWLLEEKASGGETIQPISMPIATTASAPPSTRSTHRTTCDRSARTSARALPRMGVINGATIIAPMTVAVESPTTPALAMIEASTSSPQNRVELGLRSRRSMNRASVIRWTAVTSTDAMAGPLH